MQWNRALTQKSIGFFKDSRSSLFSTHDVRFGTSVAKGFAYTGDQHYK